MIGVSQHLLGNRGAGGRGQGETRGTRGDFYPNAQFPMPNAQCPMPNAQCPMPHAPCPITKIL
ncbi:MAG: hypothetical protein ACRAVC_00460 [Trichormus sp.]